MERAASIPAERRAREKSQYIQAARAWHGRCSGPRWAEVRGPEKERAMNNVFYIIGVVVVVLAILGYFGFR